MSSTYCSTFSSCTACLTWSSCNWCESTSTCFDVTSTVTACTDPFSLVEECASSSISNIAIIWATLGGSFILLLLILIPVLICCCRRRRTHYTVVGNIQANPQASVYRAPPPHYNTAYVQQAQPMPNNYSAYGTAPYQPQYQQPYQHVHVQPAPAMHAPYNVPTVQAPPPPVPQAVPQPQNFAPSAPE